MVNPPSLPISVVIPSLGRSTLHHCLNSLFSGTSIPCETIVCLPPSATFEYLHPTLTILNSTKTGQLHQRLHALLASSSPYILQLDDDMYLEPDCLVRLYATAVEMPFRSSFGPVYYDSSDGTCWHTFPTGITGFCESLYQSIFHLLPWGVDRMGKVSTSCFSWGVQPLASSTSPYPVEWLAGGCILYHREHIIYDVPSFFFAKAYSEDLYYSFLRRRDFISHYVVLTAGALTPRDCRSLRPSLLFQEYLTRLSVAKHIQCSPLLFTLGFLVDLLRIITIAILRSLFHSYLAKPIFTIIRLLRH